MKQQLPSVIIHFIYALLRSYTWRGLSLPLFAGAFVLFSAPASAQLVQQWEVMAAYEGSTEQNLAKSTIDQAGNLYLLGSQSSAAGGRGMTVMKYSPAGEVVWHQKLANYPGAELDSPISLKVNRQGEVYVLALMSRSSGGQGLQLIKLSGSGEELWRRSYQYGSNTVDRASDLVLTADDAVYVTAYSVSSQGQNLYTLKLDAAGNINWVSRLDNMKSFSTYGATIALDPAGDPLLAFRGREITLDGGVHSYLVKLNRNDGSIRFAKKASEAETSDKLLDPRRLHINGEGMVYTVSQISATTGYAIQITKADAEGNTIWSKVEADAGSLLMFWEMAVDAEENLIMSTWPNGSNLIKYSKDGEKVWVKSHKAGIGRAVAVDANGNIALTGGLYDLADMRSKMVLQLYDKQGELLLDKTFDAVEPAFTEGYDLIFDGQNQLYLAGVGRQERQSYIVAIKYGEDPVDCEVPVTVKLSLPPGGHPVGKAINTSAFFEGEALPAELNPRWTWGDGSSSEAYHKAGDNHVTGQHTYGSAGIYTVGLDFDGTCLEPASDEYTQHIAIFDPNAGFVTGGGWFIPANVPGMIPDNVLKIQFDFNIRYQQQEAAKPTGSTSFKLTNALRFKSTSYDWLVVKEDRAVWQGSGQINGYGDFGFIVSVADAGEGNNIPADMLRVRIWDKKRGNRLYYDSYASGEVAYFLPEQGPEIGGGNIVIHRNGKLNANKKEGVFASLSGEEAKGLEAYPNPFAGRSTLRFELQEAGQYRLALYDLKGGLVQEIKQGSAQAAELVEVQVEAGKLPKGMYLARLVTDHEVRSVKLVVQH